MLNIIPTPRYTEKRDGAFSLSSSRVFCSSIEHKGVLLALSALCEEIGRVAGEYIPLSSAAPFGRAVIVRAGDNEECEEYTLTVGENEILIESDGARGAFYGVQSLRQLVRLNGREIPACTVKDSPDFSYRGFYHDVTRGRVPTLEKLKEIADTLAFYKINSLQLYIEDAFTFKELEGIVTPECALTPSEILELDSYCRERYIELIPSMATFGHLFTLLQSEKYNCISELGEHKLTRNYWLERQWHHTVDVYNPETIKVISSMMEQYLPLFSSKYFNICCDETMDLCRGKNEGKDKAEAYFYHLDKLIALARSYGKTVMLWGDECMAYPDMAKERVPSDAVVLNWCYRREVNEWIPKMFWERGFTQVACTGTSCWDNFMENINISVKNISSFAAHAKKYDIKGILNTNWGDFGHVCPFSCNLYGLMFGAQKSWNVDAVTDEDFEKAASLLLYGIRDFNMADVLRNMGRAMRGCSWSEFVIWHSAVTLENKTDAPKIGRRFDGEFSADMLIGNIETCHAEAKRLLTLGRDDKIICDLLLSVRGIELMNREVLLVNGVEGYTDKASLQKDFNTWLLEYSRAWLRDDKPSGLSKIQDFIRNITNVPV